MDVVCEHVTVIREHGKNEKLNGNIRNPIFTMASQRHQQMHRRKCQRDVQTWDLTESEKRDVKNKYRSHVKVAVQTESSSTNTQSIAREKRLRTEPAGHLQGGVIKKG